MSAPERAHCTIQLGDTETMTEPLDATDFTREPFSGGCNYFATNCDLLITGYYQWPERSEAQCEDWHWSESYLPDSFGPFDSFDSAFRDWQQYQRRDHE